MAKLGGGATWGQHYDIAIGLNNPLVIGFGLV